MMNLFLRKNKAALLTAAMCIFFTFMSAFLLLVSLPICVKADTAPYQAIIWDEADLLSPSEESALLSYMNELLPYGNAIVYTTTLSSDADYEKNAENTYYNNWGNEPGVLFQIDMGNRKLTLSASTDMEKKIGRERSSIVDNIYTYASDGDYFSCCRECFAQINTVLNNGKIAHTMKYIDNALLAILLALVINFVIIFGDFTRRKNLSKVLLTGSVVSATLTASKKKLGKRTRTYNPPSSGSSGGSSGGGGGGGFSGGSSSHGF